MGSSGTWPWIHPAGVPKGNAGVLSWLEAPAVHTHRGPERRFPNVKGGAPKGFSPGSATFPAFPSRKIPTPVDSAPGRSSSRPRWARRGGLHSDRRGFSPRLLPAADPESSRSLAAWEAGVTPEPCRSLEGLASTPELLCLRGAPVGACRTGLGCGRAAQPLLLPPERTAGSAASGAASRWLRVRPSVRRRRFQSQVAPAGRRGEPEQP